MSAISLINERIVHLSNDITVYKAKRDELEKIIAMSAFTVGYLEGLISSIMTEVSLEDRKYLDIAKRSKIEAIKQYRQDYFQAHYYLPDLLSSKRYIETLVDKYA